ncbi:MAG: hypothetical protein EON60_06985 [Alphaproteobacteria bacterium]|nr:MAG: hypothetical protein EON60_06985 [Alphaproteobacteria bacterium]
MEEVLHYIQELQRIADDLAVGDVDIVRYEDDCEAFLVKLETFVALHCYEQAGFLENRIGHVRANFGALLRQNGDMERYQNLVKRGLDGVYRSIKNPPVERGDEDYGE